MNKTGIYYKIIRGEIRANNPRFQFLFNFFKIIFRIFDKFKFDNCLIRASGLAFNSLLALVPLSATIFAFGGLNNISSNLQDFLVEILLPSSLNQIVEALNSFTENSAKLGTYGIILFLLTILFLMNNIENNLNAIWMCKTNRTFFQKITIYTTVIVFGSLLIGGNYSISGTILANIPYYNEALKNPILLKLAYTASSVAFITLTFMLIILMIPSIKVSIKSNFIGAFTGAILWEMAKWGFKTWANYSVRNSVIYGSLFLIPLLLIWLYVVWLIIMVTMETAYTHNNKNKFHIRYNKKNELTCIFHCHLELYLFIVKKYSGYALTQNLAEFWSQNFSSCFDLDQSLNILLEKNLIIKSNKGKYFPSTPPENIKISQLIVNLSGLEESKIPLIRDFIRGGEKELHNSNVSDLIKNDEYSQ